MNRPGPRKFHMSGWHLTTYWHKIERHFLQVVKHQTTHFNGDGDGRKVIVK